MNMKDYGVGRDDGLALALRLVEAGGIEALRKEIKDRGIHGIHTSYAEKELWSKMDEIKRYMSMAACATAVSVLMGWFRFGLVRLLRFAHWFDQEISHVYEDPAYLEEMLDTAEKKGIYLRPEK